MPSGILNVLANTTRGTEKENLRAETADPQTRSVFEEHSSQRPPGWGSAV